METIPLMRQMIEYFRTRKKDLHMIFSDLEKAYDKVSRKSLICNDKEGHSWENTLI